MNNQINQKPKRATRPDKTIFFVMMGAFFVFFSLPAFYWANYNYGEYNRTADFVRELREKTTTNLIPSEKKEIESRISINSSMIDRYKLEMILSGAGGLILFGIALILFTKAFKSRNRKNFYETVDWRTIPIPAAPIKVRYKNSYNVLFWVIVLFFGGIFLLTTYQSFTNPFITTENAIIRTSLLGVPVILFLSIFLFLMFRAKRNSVHLIDDSGVTRGDGRHFSWNDFCGIISQTAFNQRTQRRYLWREEFAFENGETAWIIPNRIKNYNEISAFLDALPRTVLK